MEEGGHNIVEFSNGKNRRDDMKNTICPQRGPYCFPSQKRLMQDVKILSHYSDIVIPPTLRPFSKARQQSQQYVC